MIIGVIGSGALGLYYGAQLQRYGHEVRFLMRRDLDAVRHQGLTVTSPLGDFHLPQVNAFARPEDMGEVDLVLIGLKAYANDTLIPLVRPLVGPHTAILTLQNGLGNEELLATAFGDEKILGGIAYICSNRGEPGTVHHLGEGKIRLGEFSGGLTARAESIAGMFRDASVPCEAVDDLRRIRWEKLIWNIPFNGLCALTGKTTTELLAEAPMRQLIRDLMAEVIHAANAHKLSKPLDVDTTITSLMSMTDAMDHYRPSMMIDRLEGRPLELAAIYGVPLERARGKRVDMVRVEMLYALLEAGELRDGQV